VAGAAGLLMLCALGFFSIITAGCGSSQEVVNLGAEERFALGKQEFDDGDYLDAIRDFQIVKLQYPGSSVADDAQFYMGESHFNRGEYLLAVEDYRTLKRNMASSPLVAMSQYKTAMCYYMLAPRPELDQTYTRQAIDEFQAFVEYYPVDERRADAEDKIRELNGRLAEKLFDTAEQYVKLSYYRAAGVYYDFVIQKYHDTPYAEPAHLGKIRTLLSRNRPAEAAAEIDRFIEKYPDSSAMPEILNLRRQAAGPDVPQTTTAVPPSDPQRE
jgi:outer membrane protein assembly factor BamD